VSLTYIFLQLLPEIVHFIAAPPAPAFLGSVAVYSLLMMAY
jgi:hypothetical protein